MAEGIEVRHAKACRSHGGGRCGCRPTYRASVWSNRDGKLLRKSFPTQAAAKSWRADAQGAIRSGALAGVRPTAQTVAGALEALLAGMEAGTVLDRSGRAYKPATCRSYGEAARKYLLPPLGHLRLAEVRRVDVQRVVDRMHAEGLAGSTIRNKLDPLRVVYRRALQDDELTRNPTENLRLPGMKAKARRVADADRAGTLLDALPPAERAVWACMFYGGLRVGEARALRWSDVDVEARVVNVRAGWDDKEGEQDTKSEAGARKVPLVGELRAMMIAHKIASGRRDEDLCFGRTAGAAFTRSTLRARALRSWGWKLIPNPALKQDTAASPREVWVKAHDAALEPLTPHEARHCCASYYAKAGLSVKEAQEALGHADPRTTIAIYQHALPGWQKQAVTKLDDYFGSSRGKTAGKSDADSAGMSRTRAG